MIGPLQFSKKPAQKQKKGFLQIKFHINVYSMFYVYVKSQTYACSSTCNNNTQ